MKREEIIKIISESKNYDVLNFKDQEIDYVAANLIVETLIKDKDKSIGVLLRNNKIERGFKPIISALKVCNLFLLDLGNTKIGDIGAVGIAKALRFNSTLDRLELDENQIKDIGTNSLAWALQLNTTLKILALGNNQIGDDGAKNLAEALRSNTTLQILELGNNQIGDDGAKNLAEALRSNTTLKTLYLGKNQIGDQGAEALAEALEKNLTLTSFDLGENQIINKVLEKKISDLIDRNNIFSKVISDKIFAKIFAGSKVPLNFTDEESRLIEISPHACNQIFHQLNDKLKTIGDNEDDHKSNFNKLVSSMKRSQIGLKILSKATDPSFYYNNDDPNRFMIPQHSVFKKFMVPLSVNNLFIALRVKNIKTLDKKLDHDYNPQDIVFNDEGLIGETILKYYKKEDINSLRAELYKKNKSNSKLDPSPSPESPSAQGQGQAQGSKQTPSSSP
jgi:hypothetical protein